MITPAVDLGGTYAKGALVDGDGHRVWQERIDTHAANGFETVIDRVTELLASLIARARSDYDYDSGPVGLAVPGLVDDQAGVAVFSANLGWRDLPLAASLSQQLGPEVVLSHDVTAGGVAEARLGAGKGAQTVLVVPIGTGIAAALVQRGRPYRGAHGAALEVGHLPMPGCDEPCSCGQTGCLERVASAAGIARLYARLAGVDSRSIDAEQVRHLAEAGHSQAAEIWDQARSYLSQAMCWLARILDPDRIVIGGGLAQAGDALIRPIADQLAANFSFIKPANVVTAQLGSWAGVVGAALLARDRDATATARD
ncbi:MAG: ROK family protein [Micrococcales bacterium]|nr:ROK family protein [Micrococcales bacterium]